MTMHPPPENLRAGLDKLQALLDSRLTRVQSVRDQHGRDEGYMPPASPDAVAYAESTEEVAAILQICSAQDIPVVPFGAGSSLEGHVLAEHGGISLDVTRMNRVLEVNNDDLDCRVQAGVTRLQLGDHLRASGLFFPVDPGADATLGGMVATGASGTNAVRYGTMRQNVLGLTVVLPTGEIVRTGTRARKSSAGYDLTRLFVGSEGTLGVITEVALRLYGVPEAVSAAVCQFDDLGSAVRTVIETMQLGVPIARIELLDEVAMDAVIDYQDLRQFAVQPTLFLEFHGTDRGVVEQAEQVQELAGNNGATGFSWATATEDRNRLWKARHEVLWAALARQPGYRRVSTDVCVPISHLEDAITAARADIDSSGLVAPIVGHVGDGNFHLLLMVDPDNHDQLTTAKEINTRMVERALKVGGTCTGEHGIGLGKREFLEREHGPGVEVMRSIKHAIDPGSIMNPGKIFRL